MTDDELIVKLDLAGMRSGLTNAELNRVIELMRIGAAVQPRPISEADPKKSGMIFYMKPNRKKGTGWSVGLAYPSVSGKFVNEIVSSWHEIGEEGYFIPLSALPVQP